MVRKRPTQMAPTQSAQENATQTSTVDAFFANEKKSTKYNEIFLRCHEGSIFFFDENFFSNSPFKYYPKWHSVIKVKTVPPLEFLHIFNQLITHQISANTTNPRDDKFSSTPIKQNIPNGIFKLNSSGFYRHMAYDVERNSFTVFFLFSQHLNVMSNTHLL